jgi:hypothetical protein
VEKARRNFVEMVKTQSAVDKQAYFSLQELAARWRCSRPTVYNRLRSVGAHVLDFGAPGKKSKKVVSAAVVEQIEFQKTKKLR